MDTPFRDSNLGSNQVWLVGNNGPPPRRERNKDSIKGFSLLLLLLFSAIKSDGNASNRWRWDRGRHQNPFRDTQKMPPMSQLRLCEVRSAQSNKMRPLSYVIRQWNATFMIWSVVENELGLPPPRYPYRECVNTKHRTEPGQRKGEGTRARGPDGRR